MYRNFFKRLLDIILSLILLPFIILVIIIMAPIIYLNDPGPIFYNAPRKGKRGKPFKMFKFRSMYVNSPDVRNNDGSTFNSDNDPRVNRVGIFMRKTSIDELPQLLNVLIGNMSFVGPRPTLNSYTLELKDMDPIVRKRYEVRPGITGYAQAFFRNSISQTEKYELDAFYVENMRFSFDIKILLHTFFSVLRRDNINAKHTKV